MRARKKTGRNDRSKIISKCVISIFVCKCQPNPSTEINNAEVNLKLGIT